MENHFHLVMTTPKANLVSGMKWFLGVYTGRFNRRHKLVGHLFSGRYKTLVVNGSGNGYLKTVCDYVHLNPVRAGLVAADRPLASFPWSSYPWYLRKPSKRSRWLRVEPLLAEHGIPKDSAAGRRQFELRMEQRRATEDKEQWQPVRRGWCLGDKQFRKELLAQMKERRGDNHYGEEALETEIAQAESVVRAEMKKLGWSQSDLTQRRKGDPKKVALAMHLRRETTMTLKWIAQRLVMGAAGSLANQLRAMNKNET